ncbi:hypothetical protein N8766_05830 [bacterium]|nr:hypothetical protein [bacterium]
MRTFAPPIGRIDPIGIWTAYQAEIPLASALPTRLACSSMETIQFAVIQWPEVFMILGVLAIGALLFGLLIYTVIRLSRK